MNKANKIKITSHVCMEPLATKLRTRQASCSQLSKNEPYSQPSWVPLTNDAFLGEKTFSMVVDSLLYSYSYCISLYWLPEYRFHFFPIAGIVVPLPKVLSTVTKEVSHCTRSKSNNKWSG